MAYSDFSLRRLKKTFNLTEKYVNLFPVIKAIEPSDWLKETLDLSLDLAFSSASEKARSEFIIVPVLLEIERIYKKSFNIFSGKNLDADVDKGLNGECDFILTKDPIYSSMQAPIFALLEAKKNDVQVGLGQCAAQMLGATIFNKNEGNDVPFIYGCVSTGEIWQFIKIENNVIMIDRNRFYVNELNKIIGIFRYIIDSNGIKKLDMELV